MTASGQAEHDLNWVVTNFVDRVHDVAHAVVASSDGLVLAVSQGFPRQRADQLATVTAGLASLTEGAARVFEAGLVVQTIVEMEAGVLVVMTISKRASLAVLAAPSSDLGHVAYEMSLLVERVGKMLSPRTRHLNNVAAFGK